MYLHRTILCPVDFSDASAGALRYAVGIASNLGTRLIVLTVEDPLPAEVLDAAAGVMWSPEDCRPELIRFASKALGDDPQTASALEYEVGVGHPAAEILRVARERSCDLIVMGSRGVTGRRKLFLGSTTERVVRDTSCPVLVTPPDVNQGVHVREARQIVGRILVPVDLTVHSPDQVRVAATIAEAVSVPLILVHVMEPVRTRLAAGGERSRIQAERRTAAEARLKELAGAVPAVVRAGTLVTCGDPAEELARAADDRRAGLVVMGLHGARLAGPRPGSVTYRMLCLTRTPVLAIPPAKVVQDELPSTARKVAATGA